MEGGIVVEDRQELLRMLKIKRPFEKEGETLRAMMAQNPDFDPVCLF